MLYLSRQFSHMMFLNVPGRCTSRREKSIVFGAVTAGYGTVLHVSTATSPKTSVASEL